MGDINPIIIKKEKSITINPIHSAIPTSKCVYQLTIVMEKKSIKCNKPLKESCSYFHCQIYHFFSIILCLESYITGYCSGETKSVSWPAFPIPAQFKLILKFILYRLFFDCKWRNSSYIKTLHHHTQRRVVILAEPKSSGKPVEGFC